MAVKERNNVGHHNPELGDSNVLLAGQAIPGSHEALSEEDRWASLPKRFPTSNGNGNGNGNGSNGYAHPALVASGATAPELQLTREPTEAEEAEYRRSGRARARQDLAGPSINLRRGLRVLRNLEHPGWPGHTKTDYMRELEEHRKRWPSDATLSKQAVQDELQAVEEAIAQHRLDQLDIRRQRGSKRQKFIDWYARQGSQPLLRSAGVSLDTSAESWLQKLRQQRPNPEFISRRNLIALAKKSGALALAGVGVSAAAGVFFAASGALSVSSGAVAGFMVGRSLVRSGIGVFVNNSARLEDNIARDKERNIHYYESKLMAETRDQLPADAMAELMTEASKRTVQTNRREVLGMVALGAAMGLAFAPAAHVASESLGLIVGHGAHAASAGAGRIVSTLHEHGLSSANTAPQPSGHNVGSAVMQTTTTLPPNSGPLRLLPPPTPAQMETLNTALHGPDASRATDFMHWVDQNQRLAADEWARTHSGNAIPPAELETRMAEKIQAFGHLAQTPAQPAIPLPPLEVPEGSGLGIYDLVVKSLPGHTDDFYARACQGLTQRHNMFNGIQTYIMPDGREGLYPTHGPTGSWTPEAARFLSELLDDKATAPVAP